MSDESSRQRRESSLILHPSDRPLTRTGPAGAAAGIAGWGEHGYPLRLDLGFPAEEAGVNLPFDLDIRALRDRLALEHLAVDLHHGVTRVVSEDVIVRALPADDPAAELHGLILLGGSYVARACDRRSALLLLHHGPVPGAGTGFTFRGRHAHGK